MDTDSFIIYIKTDIADDVENRFDASDYKVDRPLPTGKNKKVIGLMKDELNGRIMTEFLALRPKSYQMYDYNDDDDDDDNKLKKAKGTKKIRDKKTA